MGWLLCLSGTMKHTWPRCLIVSRKKACQPNSSVLVKGGVASVWVTRLCQSRAYVSKVPFWKYSIDTVHALCNNWEGRGVGKLWKAWFLKWKTHCVDSLLSFCKEWWIQELRRFCGLLATSNLGLGKWSNEMARRVICRYLLLCDRILW